MLSPKKIIENWLNIKQIHTSQFLISWGFTIPSSFSTSWSVNEDWRDLELGYLECLGFSSLSFRKHDWLPTFRYKHLYLVGAVAWFASAQPSCHPEGKSYVLIAGGREHQTPGLLPWLVSLRTIFSLSLLFYYIFCSLSCLRWRACAGLAVACYLNLLWDWLPNLSGWCVRVGALCCALSWVWRAS